MEGEEGEDEVFVLDNLCRTHVEPTDHAERPSVHTTALGMLLSPTQITQHSLPARFGRLHLSIHSHNLRLVEMKMVEGIIVYF